MSTPVDPCALPELIHPDQALPLLLEQVSPIQQTVSVPLTETLNGVLAEDVLSPLDLPAFNNSAMDGYAFRFADLQPNVTSTSLKVVGTALAGHPFSGDIPAGACVRIMTGAALPESLDTVQMQELVTVNGEDVQITHPSKCAANVRAQGEETTVGAVVLKRGTKIRAAEMGVLATLGIAEVLIYRKPRVAFFSTGDELQPVGTELKQGQIYDSNRYSLQALLSKAELDWIDLGIISDSPAAIEAAFIKAAEQADLILTSGGVSVGDADYVKQVLDKVGKIHFWRLAMKPGKPFAMGHIQDSVFCGLPGNPVASMVTFYQLVMPLIEKMRGQSTQPRLKLSARLTSTIRRKPGRVEYQRGILSQDAEGQLQVCSTGAQGSGMLTSMSAANCFIHIPQHQGEIREGDTVTVEPFNTVLS